MSLVAMQSLVCNLSHLIFHAIMLTSLIFIVALMKTTYLSIIASNESDCFHAVRAFIQKRQYAIMIGN